VLQDDTNFLLEKIGWRGRPAIKKSVKPTTPPSRAERLKNDVYGMQFFAELAQKHPQLDLYSPAVYESTDSYYIREYIPDQPVVSEDTGAQDASQNLKQLAKLLADIDRLEPFGQVRFVGSSNYKNLQPSIARWADENLQDKLINPDEAEGFKTISQGLDAYMQPRIAHGDMSPYKHAYLRQDNKIALIDCENFTPQAARYFDVAWSYTRMYSFAVSTDIPKQFLADFLAQAEQPPHQTEQLMAALIQRTLGMQKDAGADRHSKGIDYRPRAKELMALVLQNKLGLLHS